MDIKVLDAARTAKVKSYRRKIGGQAKHPGKQREMLPADKVDDTKVLPAPEDCPECGHKLEPERQS